MKVFSRFVLSFIVILGLVHIYPQALLINSKHNVVENICVVDKKIIKDYKYLKVNVKIPQITCLKDKEQEKVINNKIYEWTNMWIMDVEKLAKEYFGAPKVEQPTFPYELTSNYIVKNSNEILSLYIDYYQYTGGAHGITTRVPYNIDIKTGKELMLKDLFKEGYDYKSIINNSINNEIAKNPDNYFQGKEGFNGVNEKQTYYLEENNIIIYFPYYEIAPYAFGMPEFKIPLKTFENNLVYDKI